MKITLMTENHIFLRKDYKMVIYDRVGGTVLLTTHTPINEYSQMNA